MAFFKPIMGLFICAALVACSQPAANAPVMPDFDAALNAHFKAITSRDLEAYEKTITQNEVLPLIFPGGSTLMTRQDVLDFHKTWFEDKNWIMEPEIIGTYVGNSFAVATTRYTYRDTPEGDPRSALLGLVFELQNGQWRLIHDQNTRIEPNQN